MWIKLAWPFLFMMNACVCCKKSKKYTSAGDEPIHLADTSGNLYYFNSIQKSDTSRSMLICAFQIIFIKILKYFNVTCLPLFTTPIV